MADDARVRLRALASRGFGEAERRWLVSPQGLLTACAEAVADDDSGLFDDLAASSLWGRLDDESLQVAGPRPSERAAALICAGQLALWCRHGGGDRGGPRRSLEVAIRGFSTPADPSGPEPPPWEAPRALLDGPGSTTDDPRSRATALLDAASTRSAHPALPAVADVVHHLLPGPGEPPTSKRTRLPILTSRHFEGELVYLVIVERSGPPGIALDPLVGTFTRPDAAFAAAMETAWRANHAPSLSARWSVISERTGVALEVIQGRSVGAGAALALHYLGHPGGARLPSSWAITGAVDDSGSLISLLEDEHSLAIYRTKLMAAGDRTVVVPTYDHPHLAGLVEPGGLKAKLQPAASVVEVIAIAKQDAAANDAYARAKRPDHGQLASVDPPPVAPRRVPEPAPAPTLWRRHQRAALIIAGVVMLAVAGLAAVLVLDQSTTVVVPTDVKATRISDTSVVVTWRVPPDHQYPILIIQSGTAAPEVREQIVPGPQTSRAGQRVDDLDPHQGYCFQVGVVLSETRFESGGQACVSQAA
ncbi:MAG: fibronectin type III domain-containing protein [Acidimicrobiales bacterium]